MALAACIATFGGLIPSNVRGTIDSITHTCLSTLYLRGGSSIFAYSNVKRALLQLGMNCVCVPWGDGGRSNHGRCLDYLRGGSLHLFGHRQKLRVLGKHAEHGLRPNHADAGLPGFGIDRNAARESHIEGHVGR